MESHYRLKLAVGRVSLEVESHDKEWVELKHAEFLRQFSMDLGGTSGEVEANEDRVSAAKVEAVDAGLTINEFYKKYISGKSYSNLKIALLLVYYLEKVKKVDSLSTAGLREAFRDISFPKYDRINYADIGNKLKSGGFLNKIDNNWKLTFTGLDEVLGLIATS